MCPVQQGRNMEIRKLAIPGVMVVIPRRFGDDRGFFSEVYNARTFRAAGIDVTFIQDNHSYSVATGTVCGLHYQSPPHVQAKLVRVLHGRIFDVAVDARLGAPTFGQWVGAELSADGGEQIFVPAGFLHGFITLEPGTHVAYKVDGYYAGSADGAVRYDDPDLAIDWGGYVGETVLSEKDGKAQKWADFETPFVYAGDRSGQ
jgi:dTDP-4-dehydrorhamnose 3,5-epimerase